MAGAWPFYAFEESIKNTGWQDWDRICASTGLSNPGSPVCTFGLWDWLCGREAFSEVTLRSNIDKKLWDPVRCIQPDIPLASPVEDWPPLSRVTFSSQLTFRNQSISCCLLVSSASLKVFSLIATLALDNSFQASEYSFSPALFFLRLS